MYLENINGPQDIKKLQGEQLDILSNEVREVLIEKLSNRGGHFAPNLGMVEATIALHHVFNSPKDKFVFDVSHQSYAHKMLTGRKNAFLVPADYDKVSGYTEPSESEHDFFVIGHTSTSVSLACGLAKGRDLLGDKENIIAIIGDGSLSGGEALEGLDFAAELKSNFIVVVNDNQMSIAENHGGLYQNLQELRESNGTATNNFFKTLGLDYLYVANGNDVHALIEAFKKVKDSPCPVVVHINTVKGKGYAPAEQNKEAWHYCVPFVRETGEPKDKDNGGEDYGDLTAQYLLGEMKNDPALVAISAGTPLVLGFTEDRRVQVGTQFVDVGIAEEHAVAMASGLAARGAHPVFGVYSTFLQRAYDQLSQDLCINDNPATILVFWETLSGMNDVTHLCFFDIPLLCNIPNLVYLAPTSAEEYFAMLKWSIAYTAHPVAIRVPANGVIHSSDAVETDFCELNKFKKTRTGKQVAIVAAGSFYQLGESVADALKAKNIDATLINPRYLTGLDTAMLEDLKRDHSLVITLEDGVIDGGFGEKISRFYGASDMKVRNYGASKMFVDRFDLADFLKANRLTAEQIVDDVLSILA